MDISNNLTAPCLLIAAMVILILFQGVFFANGDVIYTEPEIPPGDGDYVAAAGLSAGGGDFMIFNNIKYKPDKFFILAVISNLCAFLLPAVFYIKIKGAGYSKNLKLCMPKPRYIALSLYMFFALISGAVLINSLLFYSSGTEAVSENVLPFIFHTGGNPVYDTGVFISFVILPAFCEEFFFRSVLSAEYEKYGSFCAAVITSAAFAMSHFSLKFFPSYFFAAIILYILAKITNSVLLAVILHAGYNFFNIYLWDKISGVLNFEQNRFIFIFVTAVIFTVMIIFVLNGLEMIYYKKAYNNEPSPVFLQEINRDGKNKKNKYKTAAVIRLFKSVFSPTFIAATVIFFIYINI